MLRCIMLNVNARRIGALKNYKRATDRRKSKERDAHEGAAGGDQFPWPRDWHRVTVADRT